MIIAWVQNLRELISGKVKKSSDWKGKNLRNQKIVAGATLVLILISIVGFKGSPVARSLSRGEKISFLMSGIDAADKSQHTDTLLLAVFDPLQYMLSLVSLPRDTRINLPGYLFHRVNEIYGYHMRKTHDPNVSMKHVMAGVEHFLSPEEHSVSIPYFVQVDYSGFTKLVDLLGGVWVEVDQPMHYDDNAGHLHIHFDPGRHLLNGNEALRYVRYRGQTGDRGRIFRQQEFLRNMVKRFANPINILKFPRMVAAVAQSVHTNLSFWDIIYLANSSRRIRSDTMGFYILPGKSSGPYWQINKDATMNLVSKLFFNMSMAEEYVEPIVPQMDQVTVNVWNASGKKGLAYQVTKYLRANGFDVVDWGTYTLEQAPTRVIDRNGNILNAKSVGHVLGIESCHSEPNPKAMVDVEIVLGKDYQGPGL